MITENLLSAIGNVSDKFVEEAAPGARRVKRPFFRSAVALAATAAVICLAVFGNMFLHAPVDNTFTLKVYAADGSITQLADPSSYEAYTSRILGAISFSLECDGDTVREIEFTTKEGAFSVTYPGGERVVKGRKMTLDNAAVKDALLDWHKGEGEAMPAQIAITATVKFANGETATREITINVKYIDELREADIAAAKIVAEEYYKTTPFKLTSIEFSSDLSEQLWAIHGYGDEFNPDAARFEPGNLIVFETHIAEFPEPKRTIALGRENKTADWNVINEGW